MLYVILGLALVGVVAGVYLHRPSMVVIPAVPASYIVTRLGAGGGGNNISYSDFFLFLATLAALPMVDWRRARRLKPFLVLAAFYLATELFSVLDHPNRYDIVEFFHQMVLVAGAAIVGFVIADRGGSRLALGSFVAISAVVALWSMALFVSRGFHLVGELPFDYQKNLLGDLFAVAVLVTQFNPSWVNLPRRSSTVAKYLCLGGVVAVQSRQAMVAIIVALVAGLVRDRRLGISNGRRRPVLLYAALVPVAAVVYVTVTGQLSSGSSHSSIGQRSIWYSQSLHLWSQYPFFGVGERFWYTNLYGLTFQPPNAEISQLATGGAVGLLGLVVLMIGGIWMMARLPKAAGSLAFAVVIGHVVEGQFDIFWVSPSGSLPWIIAGMAMGAVAIAERPGAGPTWEVPERLPARRVA